MCFEKELNNSLHSVLKNCPHITKQKLYSQMGFPENREDITAFVQWGFRSAMHGCGYCRTGQRCKKIFLQGFMFRHPGILIFCSTHSNSPTRCRGKVLLSHGWRISTVCVRRQQLSQNIQIPGCLIHPPCRNIFLPPHINYLHH